ncbi:MAG TPA: prepilin-type N-terminal cleavage/methylation domain-containing protein, partial [Armatimonadota bacterium]|nr:prepilin-type N-terminal cleavage/methylation domain-containing protein [Armatimonadota bacterium]
MSTIHLFPAHRRGLTLVECIIVLAVFMVLATASLPALLRAQRTGKQNAALSVLKSLRNAETTYHIKTKSRYADLNTLKAENSSPVGEGEREKASSYTFRSSGVSGDHYTITATPPSTGMDMLTLVENDGTHDVSRNPAD